jgi:hypothetical protein
MTEIPPWSAEFTAEQIRTLQEFADNVDAGRRALRLIGWVGGGIMAVTAFTYYVSSLLHGLHSPGNPR